MTAIVKDSVDVKKRRFLTFATGAAGAAAGLAIAGPFVYSWFPSRKAVAAGAPIEVDLSKIEPGQMVTYEWRGKPMWVMRRTPDMLSQLEKNAGFLADPESKSAKQPGYVKGVARAVKPDVLVLEGVCTHLGCSPQLKKDTGNADGMGTDWPGGFYCPCHNSRFDLSGRVFAGSPAPTNLPVPPYRFASDTRLIIGEDSAGA